jgi:hypothetical protein
MLFVLSHLLSKENLFGSSKDGIELLFVDRVGEVVLMSGTCTSTIILEEINASPDFLLMGVPQRRGIFGDLPGKLV